MDLRKILLIEDEPDIRTVAEIALKDLGGLEVDAAGSVSEGLTLARAGRPDAILLDVMMPGTDGIEALGMLKDRAETRDIPVIFMTARVQPQERARYLDLGARGVIAKPFDPYTLADEVRRILI